MRVRVWLPRLAATSADTTLTCEWLDRQRHVQRRGRATLAQLPDTALCELVLHGLDAVLLEVRLPKLDGARLAAALPGLVEERLAGDAEQVHVVAGGRDATGAATAAVVDRTLLARTLTRFAAAQRRVVSATPRPLALPLQPGTWRVRLDDDHGSLRTGPQQGFGFGVDAGTPAQPPVELRLLLAQSQAQAQPKRIEVEGTCDTAAWTAALGVPVVASGAVTDAPPVALELLQYTLAPGTVVGKAWRSTAILAGLLVAVTVVGLNAHAWTLRRQEQDLRGRMADAVRTTFPQVPVVLDPVAQMRRLVADRRPGSGDGDFLALALTVAHAAAADSVQMLDYRDGTLRVTFHPGAGTPDAQRNALVAAAAGLGLAAGVDGEAVRIARKDHQ